MNNETSFYQSPKAGIIMRQLWKAAGADSYILSRSTYSDQVKYACLGGIVVATGFMAAMAGGYAFYTIFEPKTAEVVDKINMVSENVMTKSTHWPTVIQSSIFGLIWGLIIFNIDRFIVAASGKGDGTEKITWKEIKGSVPRLIMGLIIALTISKPIEIRMFQSEINAALYEKQKDERKKLEEKVNILYNDEFVKLDESLDKIETKREEYVAKVEEYDVRYQKEVSGGQGMRGKGEGPVAKTLKTERLRWEDKLNSFDKSHEAEKLALLDRKKDLQIERKNEIDANKSVAAGMDGLLERLKLAHEIAGFWISLFITLLFVVIELTPIFFKMMLVKGPYDFMLDNTKDLIKAKNGIQVVHDFYKDKIGISRDLVINHKVKKKHDMIQAQNEINEHILAKWKEDQKKKIDENIGDYIQDIGKESND